MAVEDAVSRKEFSELIEKWTQAEATYNAATARMDRVDTDITEMKAMIRRQGPGARDEAAAAEGATEEGGATAEKEKEKGKGKERDDQELNKDIWTRKGFKDRMSKFSNENG